MQAIYSTLSHYFTSILHGIAYHGNFPSGSSGAGDTEPLPR